MTKWFSLLIVAVSFVCNTLADKGDILRRHDLQEEGSKSNSSGLNEIPDDDKNHVHLVYVTGCKQEHRQFLSSSLQISLIRVGHVGPLTEVIAGCTNDEEMKIKNLPSFYPDYRLHFTRDYSKYESPTFSEEYTPYNKPFGLRDFLHNSTRKDQLPIAFIDADYMLFKPLLINRGEKWGKYYQNSTMRRNEDITDTVKDGIALAQNMRAFLAGRWFNDYDRSKLDIICEGLPCKRVSTADALEYYEPSGTPYILTRNDWLRVAEDYCNFAVKGRQIQQSWMVEMYAYGAAVANQDVKHTLLMHLGPATPAYKTTEYWQFIDETLPNPCADPFDVVLPADPPIGIHYAMYYGIYDSVDSGLTYNKYFIPTDILDCNSMMFKLPPSSTWTDIATRYPNDIDKQESKRHSVWLECTLIKYGNEVLRRIKEAQCPNGFNSHQGIQLQSTTRDTSSYPRQP